MSADLRNSLWNVAHIHYVKDDERRAYDASYGPNLKSLARVAQVQFFKLPIDDLENYGFQFVERVKKWFFKADFFLVYDFFEWLAQQYSAADRQSTTYSNVQAFCENTNSILERERSAYRFVNFQLVPITNKTEIASVNEAAEPKNGFEEIASHIQAAIGLLSDKKSPDYRNSIKESISAVEAAARILADDEKATLGDALKAIEKTKKVHPALKDGFLKIYGYSSDADGIRHALTEAPNLNESHARLMLVSCSAFANFLIEQAQN